jgi:polyisoprenoid-binding protein YceI
VGMSTWTFDNSHSMVGFAAKHMMISTVRGRFEQFEGHIDYDEADPARSSVEVRIKTASVDTNWQQRDEHLRSPDFLESAVYPEITFRSTSVEPRGEDKARIHGDLTIKDVTRPVTLDAELVGSARGFSGERQLAFEASTRIDREAWGLTWNVALEAGGVLVGKQITITLDIRAVEVARATEVQAEPTPEVTATTTA